MATDDAIIDLLSDSERNSALAILRNDESVNADKLDALDKLIQEAETVEAFITLNPNRSTNIGGEVWSKDNQPLLVQRIQAMRSRKITIARNQRFESQLVS